MSNNSQHHSAHQTAYRLRRKAGMISIKAPWDWMTKTDFQRIAVEAYMSATHALSDDLDRATPEMFARQLQEDIEVLIADAAISAGVEAAPVDAPQFAKALRQVPSGWRPQYPVFVAPQLVEKA